LRRHCNGVVNVVDVVEIGVVSVVAGIRPHGAKCKRQKLTQLLPKSRSAVLGLHTNVCPGALDDSAGSFDSLMLEAHVVALLRVHRTGVRETIDRASLCLLARSRAVEPSRRALGNTVPPPSEVGLSLSPSTQGKFNAIIQIEQAHADVRTIQQRIRGNAQE